jgi:hypothetical protein
MKGLEEARGRFAPAPPAESTPAVAPARRAGTLLSRALGRLGPALDATRNLLVSAAIVAILLVIGWSILAEARREAIDAFREATRRDGRLHCAFEGPRPRSDRPDRGCDAPVRAGRAAAGRDAALPVARPLIGAATALYPRVTTPRRPRWPTRRSSTTTPTSARSCWT